MAKINNTGIVRQLNLDIVRQALREEGGLTKSILARKTGMSIATCGNLLQLLVESGEVLEGEADNLTGGRPARTYFYNGENEMVLCVYILVEDVVTLRLELCDNLGRKQGGYDLRYDRITKQDIYEQIDQAVEKYNNIEMISIGIPGYVVDGKVEVCDEPNLNGINFIKEIKAKYDVETIVGTEKLFKVLGYYKRMKLNDENTLVYILAPRGKNLGAGIMIDGHVLRGGNEMAGETMYLPYYLIKEKGLPIDGIVKEMPFIVSTMVAIIAPQKLILSGYGFHDGSCKEICRECKKIIPERYVPEIIYVEDSFPDYQCGLIDATLEKLNRGIKVVDNRRKGEECEKRRLEKGLYGAN